MGDRITYPIRKDSISLKSINFGRRDCSGWSYLYTAQQRNITSEIKMSNVIPNRIITSPNVI